MTGKALVLAVFGCMLPGTLVLLCGFFCLLHSWLNAFAEMLRFGDRMFYQVSEFRNSHTIFLISPCLPYRIGGILHLMLHTIAHGTSLSMTGFTPTSIRTFTNYLVVVIESFPRWSSFSFRPSFTSTSSPLLSTVFTQCCY